MDGVSVAVGNLRLLAASTERDLPASVPAADGDWRGQGMTVLWVAVAGRAAGAIVVSDAPRREAAEAVTALRNQKLHCVMLTGGSSSFDGETLSLFDPAQRSHLLMNNKCTPVSGIVQLLCRSCYAV